MGKSLKVKVLSRNLSRVFSEDYEGVKEKILDPGGLAIRRWNKIFIIACFFSLFIDPLFFLVPVVREELCVDVEISLQVVLTILRSLADVFYVIQIIIRFRTAYVAPSSRIFGRGELVIDTSKIALRYLSKGFWIDFIAALPLTQVLLWVIFPRLQGPTITYRKNILLFVIVFQYIPRLILIYPLSSQIAKATGVVTKTSWAGAVYNLSLFMLASHAMGALYFLESIVRQETCWMTACDQDPSCQYGFFNCQTVDDPNRVTWFQSNNVTTLCVPVGSFYNFGIYAGAYQNDVTKHQVLQQVLLLLLFRPQKFEDEVELEARENFVADESELFRTGLALAVHSARRAESFRRSIDMYSGSESGRFSPLPKPTEPDFSVYEE
ncbi:hypothetical protein L1049_013752 [Liquidambar formosana]|uniref:Ion transport domain-containing protein n=1 Tax=Liquidambar formosana TaxID=63359 RepID=A0AAP0RPD1_LIQFO